MFNGAGAGIQDCNLRDLTVKVTGGTGNYFFTYGATTPGASIKSEDKSHIIIDPQPIAPTTYIVTVLDKGNNYNYIGNATLTVAPVMISPLDNLFIPNVFTPNFDSVNDRWTVMNAAKDPANANKAIGAYKYSLTIADRDGRTYVNIENEAGNMNTGIISGSIGWNGFRQGTLEEAPVGTYFYDLRLYNCTYPAGKKITGWIYLTR